MIAKPSRKRDLRRLWASVQPLDQDFRDAQAKFVLDMNQWASDAKVEPLSRFEIGQAMTITIRTGNNASAGKRAFHAVIARRVTSRESSREDPESAC